MKVTLNPTQYEAEQVPSDEKIPRRIFDHSGNFIEALAGDWVVMAPDGTTIFVKEKDFDALYTPVAKPVVVEPTPVVGSAPAPSFPPVPPIAETAPNPAVSTNVQPVNPTIPTTPIA